MIKVGQVVIVEGRYDKIKLSSVIDGVIIETEGFGIFKNREKQKLIRRLAAENGIVILTDSDSAGFVIRSFITSIVPAEYITNVYIPDIYGKEKRKNQPSKEGKLGVEGVSVEVISDAFKRAGIGVTASENKEKRTITLNDFYDDGLTGASDSKSKRKKLLCYLDLPERMSTKAMLDIFNLFMTYDEYKNAVGEALKMRIGHGYDVHKLVENRDLIVGGVKIDYEKGLLGHSDADVLLHAVSDSLLGAAALGDIGGMFPDNDPEFLDADSLVLLRKVYERLRENGYGVINIDATIIAQKPKMKPYIPEMRMNIAVALSLDVDRVSIKATTEEEMGFTGRGEGIAAHCICLIDNVGKL